MSKTPKKTPAKAAPTPPPPPPTVDPRHILRIEAENFKRLKVFAATIDPKRGVLPITGGNGEGKSSLLDAVMFALCGKKGMPSMPIRKGATRAAVAVDIGEFWVKRSWVAEGSPGGHLTVESKDGKGLQRSPQDLLNKLMGSISFDPLAFKRMAPVEQLEQLRSLVSLEVDIDELDRLNKVDYFERRDAWRDVEVLDVRIADIDVPADLGPRIELQELAVQLRAAVTANEGRLAKIAQVQRLKSDEERSIKDAATERSRAADLEKEIADLTRQMEEREKEAIRLDAAAAASKVEREAVLVPEAVDTAGFETQFAAARERNAAHDRLDQRQQLERERDTKQKRADQLTQDRDARTAQREAAIAAAKMPLDGLSFADDQVLYNGIPFDQLSDGEQITVSVSLGMCSQPELRVMIIRDGSLLDTKSLAKVAELAERYQYQVLMEMVDTSGKVGIVIEDGMNDEGREIEKKREKKGKA